MMADKIATACAATGIRFIYKSSFDKANRSSHNTARGAGVEKGLEILASVKDRFGCPILTDVHEASQCAQVAEVVDVLQIPAFMSRQTDLLLAGGHSGRAVDDKKGQYHETWERARTEEGRG